jgi:hypothetical protein
MHNFILCLRQVYIRVMQVEKSFTTYIKGFLDNNDFISINRRLAYLGKIYATGPLNIMLNDLNTIIFN